MEKPRYIKDMDYQEKMDFFLNNGYGLNVTKYGRFFTRKGKWYNALGEEIADPNIEDQEREIQERIERAREMVAAGMRELDQLREHIKDDGSEIAEIEANEAKRIEVMRRAQVQREDELVQVQIEAAAIGTTDAPQETPWYNRKRGDFGKLLGSLSAEGREQFWESKPEGEMIDYLTNALNRPRKQWSRTMMIDLIERECGVESPRKEKEVVVVEENRGHALREMLLRRQEEELSLKGVTDQELGAES